MSSQNGLNIGALKKMQERLNERGGSDGFLYQNKLEAENDIRLMPPLPHQNGIYNQEQIVWWINEKPYISHATFDEKCVIDEEVQAAKKEAKQYEDKELQALIDDEKKLSRKTRFIMPILHLKCDFDNSNVCKKISVIGDKPKVLVAGPVLMKAINRLVTSRNFQNGTPFGIMDIEKGTNLLVGKTGKGLNTEYSAEAWQQTWDMVDFEKLYDDTPDVIKITKDELKPNDYLRKIIRNYLYGEAMPKEEEAKEQKEDKDEPVSTGRTRGGAAKEDTTEQSSGRSRRGSSNEEANKTEEQPTGTRGNRGSSRSLVDDLKNLG